MPREGAGATPSRRLSRLQRYVLSSLRHADASLVLIDGIDRRGKINRRRGSNRLQQNNDSDFDAVHCLCIAARRRGIISQRMDMPMRAPIASVPQNIEPFRITPACLKSCRIYFTASKCFSAPILPAGMECRHATPACRAVLDMTSAGAQPSRRWPRQIKYNVAAHQEAHASRSNTIRRQQI